jgi:two-component system, cell cycle response regulator
MLSDIPPVVLLASSDSALVADLRRIFDGLGLRVNVTADGEQTLAALEPIRLSGLAAEPAAGHTAVLVLLDTRLPGMTSGRLLAAMHQHGARRHCAIALIAERAADEWIARLREGVIDDIAPRNADAETWKTRVNTMQRGHALVCELELLRQAGQAEAKHDPLTGTLNRETLLTILFRETDRVQRLHGTLSVMVFDVDDFELWNREVGREGGDQLLREVARRTDRILRTYDALGRLGRDEFLLALPGCDATHATTLAERLRMEVFGEPLWVRNGQEEIVKARLSACFGIAVSRGRSPVVVLREAEQALAHAKHAGPGSIRYAGGMQPRVETNGAPRLFAEPETLMG